MFYDRFKQLCDQKGVSPNRACLDMQLSRSVAAKWKNTGATPSRDALVKISDYFNVTVEFLLTGEQKEMPSKEDGTADEELRFALFGGAEGITDEMFEEVKRFAQFVKMRERDKQ